MLLLNIVLFEPEEIGTPLDRRDPRAIHILEILRRHEGEPFDAGIVGGPRGKGWLAKQEAAQLHLRFEWGEHPPPLFPLTLILGLSRPQTARKILQEATSLGVATLCFVRTDRSEPSYADSSLWSSGEWRKHVLDGASQAFCTRLPTVAHGESFTSTVESARPGLGVALDNYEAASDLMSTLLKLRAASSGDGTCPVTIAIGSERGWSKNERAAFRANGFTLAHLGQRVLRTETAAVASVAIARAAMGWL